MRLLTRYGGWKASAASALAALVLLAGAVPGIAQDATAMGGGGERGPDASFAGARMVRGTVTAAAADTLTVKTETGESYTVSVSANTRVMKARQPLKLADVKPGDAVGAMGELDAPARTLHAMFVQVVDAEQVKKAQADLGKTYITGKITAMDELKLTVHRPDGVDQVIQVDEGTSFKRGGRGMGMLMGTGVGEAPGDAPRQRPQRAANAQEAGGTGPGSGGESITLADVKVGDMVLGRGALKAGIFVPTELRVMDPAARQRRRAAAEGAGAVTSQPGTQP